MGNSVSLHGAEGTLAQLQQLENRVQELAAENSRLRSAWTGRVHPSLMLPQEHQMSSNMQADHDFPAIQAPTLEEPLVLAPDQIEAMIASATTTSKAARRPLCKRSGGYLCLCSSSALEVHSPRTSGINCEGAMIHGVAKEHLANLPADTEVAVKCAAKTKHAEDDSLSPDAQRRFLREVQMLKSFRHPHIMPLLAFCVPRLALVYPWPDKGCLGHLLRTAPLDPLEGFQALLGAARGLTMLHGLRLAHRCIRSDSVFLFTPAEGGGMTAVLGDCGSAHEVDESVAEHAGFTVDNTPYLDPWYLLSGRVSPASDIFALGIVVLEVLLGKPAVEQKEEKSTTSTRRRDPDVIMPPDDATRRRRPQPLWRQFDEQVPRGAETAKAAAELIYTSRPRPDWSKRALAVAAELAIDMLRLERSADSPEDCPPERPAAATVAENLEVAAALQLCGASVRRRSRTCVVCMDAPIDTRLTPCRHSAICGGCAIVFMQREERCPICRTRVEGYEEGDFSCTFVH